MKRLQQILGFSSEWIVDQRGMGRYSCSGTGRGKILGLSIIPLRTGFNCTDGIMGVLGKSVTANTT